MSDSSKVDWKSVRDFSPKEILNLFGLTKPPIDPFLIAKELGIGTYKSYDFNTQWEIDSEGNASIFVDTDRSANIQRFICACGLGHIIMGHKQDFSSIHGINWKNVSATRFAVSLLVPKSWLIAYSYIRPEIKDLAEIFNVSEDVIRAQK